MPTKTHKKSTRKPMEAQPTYELSFAEEGRTAARERQKQVLLAACRAEGWNLAVVGEKLRMGDSAVVVRALKALAPKEYKEAKAAMKIAPGRRRPS